jgi:glycine/D-amino acid oxidase-like deaminating enzyme/nitrite reductase/ring-hydroxylating ferredoxin subunit
MNVGDERSRSCWMDVGVDVEAPPLTADATCDVVVIGSGIAGLSTAYELSRFGKSVIVIDRGRIGRGMTSRTTAHLATALDDYYFELIRARGEDEARLYHDSQKSAVNRIEAIVQEEGIDCDFARVDGYLFAARDSDRADLEKEYQACRTVKVEEVEWADRAPVPGTDTGPALRFGGQARFHPTKYLAGLARAIAANGGRFHADTTHVADEEVDGGVAITTENGPVIRARAAVFATNSPTNDKVAIHAKQEPQRTYAIAGRVPRGSVPDALVWDTLEAYHYVRLQPLSDEEDLLIVGGEDHRSGQAYDMDERIARLEQWTRLHYPGFDGIDYRWSGQVLEPIDFMPFSGRNPGNSNIYVHTGDSGQGITNGVAGSLTLLPLILGEDSRYAPLFDPGRKSAAPTAAVEFIKGQAGAARNFAEYITPGQVGSPDDLEPGQGAVIRQGLSKLAVYKADDGTIVKRSAACTHLGCLVHWNDFEKCWDCPCHGSQFAPDGAVLNGPAVKPLAEVE